MFVDDFSPTKFKYAKNVCLRILYVSTPCTNAIRTSTRGLPLLSVFEATMSTVGDGKWQTEKSSVLLFSWLIFVC